MIYLYPKISIVTPSYNQGRYIEQTILSVLNQNYPNLEYIIIDGGSTDNTIDIIKKYADRITYWVSEPDKGQSNALNKGLEKCTGELFNWINSDDYLEPNALFKLAEAFEKNRGADIFCGYARMFNDTDNVTLLNHRCQIFSNTEQTMVAQKNDQHGMFYRLGVIKELGGINENLHYVMDLELWFRYLVARGIHKFVFINELLAHFRIHPQSKTGSMELRFREEEKLLWKYMVSKLDMDKRLIDWFATDKTYLPAAWNFKEVDAAMLQVCLLDHYFYPFYKAGKLPLAKMAFMGKFKRGQLKFNFHYLALFVKLFIGNLSFRKYFKP